ncbi:glycine cleavage system protein GcvH [Nocardiopsis tropica]|uniref:glycine cleavage system protein GcvH n=1 Tax=Nocardiopsis tropica TaxID=109330 RepID=UPI002E8D2191|nr:glycine cleavage system protein GcvH [Nocardiopsis tropica]
MEWHVSRTDEENTVSQLPENLRYTDDHLWVRVDGDIVTTGLTAHGQELLSEIVLVELPEIGDEVQVGGTAGGVESVKAYNDLYASVAGEVVAVNEALVEEPGLVNEDPYGDGWIYRLRPSDPGAVDELLDAAVYRATIDQ